MRVLQKFTRTHNSHSQLALVTPMSLTLVIPARYGSTRFEGKPLAMIAGKSMLRRVYDIAVAATAGLPDARVLIATEDARVIDHAKSFGAQAVLTPEDCPTGSDRALAACQQLSTRPDIVLNLQGDAPLTPPSFVRALAEVLVADPSIDVATPVVQLSWEALDTLRENKKTTPFSGTTAILGNDNRALWFSKNILPAIRKEEKLRTSQPLSPVYKHVGLYGYRYGSLERFVSLPEGVYESLEGLEQLRMLEAGMVIRCVPVQFGAMPQIGVDTQEDARRVEAAIARYGEMREVYP